MYAQVSMSAPVLLVDTYAFKPSDKYKVVFKEVRELWGEKVHGQDEMAFLTRVFEKSGLGHHHTYLPAAIHPRHCLDKPQTDLAAASVEAEYVVCGAVEGLLRKTGLAARDIDILVTTCSIYCSTPSMASMVVNHFKMRPDIQSYHLGGMGCANGVVAVNMVADLLKAHPNTNAVFVTTEITTPAYYPGHDKHRMVTNLLFRMGAAAVLLSNKSSWAGKAKYKLQYRHRVHVGQSEEAYRAIHYSPDEQGINGIYLGKNVVTEASRALTQAMWAAGPHVLTIKQKAQFAANWATRKLLGPDAAPKYTPSFSGPVQHFLLHAGGAKVLDGLGKALQLSERDLEPSRAVLHDYGNVSSSTTWYTLGFIESVRGVRAGDKVLQVGVGSGIKCGVNVWKALRDVKEVHEAWEHRVSPQEAEAARSARARTKFHVDASFGRHHVMLRLLFILLMVLLFGVLQLVMSAGSSIAQGGAAAGSSSAWPISGATPGAAGKQLQGWGAFTAFAETIAAAVTAGTGAGSSQEL